MVRERERENPAAYLNKDGNGFNARTSCFPDDVKESADIQFKDINKQSPLNI